MKKKTDIGQCLFDLRKKEKVARDVFAARHGLSYNLVVDVENGKYQVTNKTVRKLIEAFGEDIFGPFIVTKQCKECGIDFIPNTKELFCCPEHGLLYNRDSTRVKERLQTKERRESMGWRKRSKLTALAIDNYEARSVGLSYGIWRAHKMGWV